MAITWGKLTWAELLASGELEGYYPDEGDEIDRTIAEITPCAKCNGDCEFIAMRTRESYRVFLRCMVCDAVFEF